MHMARLLIVDDENDVREFAANFFRKRKIDVTTAESGEQAIEKLQKQKADLVLLDVMMGGISGVETLKRIKELYNEIKVIMVTGRKPEEDGLYDKCQQLGAIDYIHKPLELDELEAKVLSILSPKS